MEVTTVPNNESTKKAEERRLAREAQSGTMAAKASTAEIDRKPTPNTDPAAKRPPDAPEPGVDNQSRIATNTPGIVKTQPAGTKAKAPSTPAARREQKIIQRQQVQEAAAAQAHRDAMRHPEPVPDNYKVGDTIPLHVLNQRAKLADAEARDEALKIAKETQAFVHDRIIGHQPRSIVSRSRKMRDAIALRERALEANKNKG